jgi:flagellar basal-body rod modification protein FlgD
MSISSISSTVATTAASTASTSTSTSSSFDSEDFLTLLVEQLQNQDPLSPTDTSEIMNQMVSFASYDAQTKTNETLSEISTTLGTIASRLDVTV